MTAELRLAYDGAAEAWAHGPARLYDKLASLTIAAVAGEFRGALVLDVGAGTGALCRALRAAGAIPVALDTSIDMLARAGAAAMLAVAGDMCALPFPGRQFDAAVSGFAISHVDEPQQALTEMGRVVRPGGRVIAAVFGATSDGASKQAVDEVAAAFGYEPPAWYVRLKVHTEPRSNTPERLIACARAAGLSDIDVDDRVVDSGLDTPEDIAAYRAGMAHMAPFVASLPDRRRAAFLRQAVVAIRTRGEPLRPRVLILSSRSAADARDQQQDRHGEETETGADAHRARGRARGFQSDRMP